MINAFWGKVRGFRTQSKSQNARAGKKSQIIQSGHNSIVGDNINITGIEESYPLDLDLNARDDADNIVYFLPFQKNKHFALPLNILISNNGNLGARDCRVVLDLPEHLYRHAGVTRNLPNTAKILTLQHAVDPIDGTHRVQVFLAISSLGPRNAISIGDTIFSSSSTDLEIPVEARTKDNVNITANVKVNFSHIIKISISSTNHIPKQREFHVYFKYSYKGTTEYYLKYRRKISSLEPKEFPEDGTYTFVKFETYSRDWDFDKRVASMKQRFRKSDYDKKILIDEISEDSEDTKITTKILLQLFKVKLYHAKNTSIETIIISRKNHIVEIIKQTTP